MADVLVTGASGFIGRHLVARLRNARHTVREVDSQSGDIAAGSTWASFPDAEVVIHLAGKTFVPDSWTDPAGFFRTNVSGTICALEYCRTRQSQLIFISSYLYGPPESLPISESAKLQANNPYALSKKLAEEACRFYSDFYEMSITILRPFNIYGPGQNPKFLIPSIIQQVFKETDLNVKDLEPRRDYLYIDDLTDAFAKAIENPQRFGIFNIASGTSHSVREVIELIQKLAQKNLPVRSSGERRPQEIMDTRADISKAVKLLGWHPSWSLAAGCAHILKDKKSAC
jgi:GDP-4-dehydro-6-deoxy-D-mannose reductase